MITIGDFTFDSFWIYWGIGTFVGLRLIGKLIKALFVYRVGRDLIGYTNAYGGGDLRRDREPRFFAPKKRR